jgi:hypothetical protein
MVKWKLHTKTHPKLRTEMVAAFHLSMAQTASTANCPPRPFPLRSTLATLVRTILDRTRGVIEPRAPRTSAPLTCEPPSQRRGQHDGGRSPTHGGFSISQEDFSSAMKGYCTLLAAPAAHRCDQIKLGAHLLDSAADGQKHPAPFHHVKTQLPAQTASRARFALQIQSELNCGHGRTTDHLRSTSFIVSRLCTRSS